MAPLQIGAYTLSHGLLLAPMAGVADTTYRLLCREQGAEYTVSEMVSAKALCFEQRGKGATKTAFLVNSIQEEMPMAIQIFGREPDYMAEAARLIASGAYRGASQVAPPAAIDINMGCPVHKVVSNGEGSALMREPKLAAEILRAVKRAVDLPVTVKIRAGFSEEEKNAPELAKRLEDAGADMICVHGRTRSQFYAPTSDNAIIAAVKRAVSVPVVGNGDVNGAADALRMWEETECDGVMVARGSLGNPWVFAEICAALEGKPFVPPTCRERLEMALRHATDLVARKGERVGIAEARKHMAWYCKGLRGAAAARDTLISLGDYLDEASGRNAEFSECRFEKCTFSPCNIDRFYFVDCVFDKCDLSAMNFRDCTFHRVTFTGCRASGLNLSESVLRNVQFLECLMPYSNLAECKLTHVKINSCNLEGALLSSMKHSDLKFDNCSLKKAELHRTPLKALNLTTCDIGGITVEISDLRGAVVREDQALMLSKLMGLVIRE